MNDPDDFLTQCRTPPRREFADRLYRTLSADQPALAPRHPLLRRLTLALAMLVVLSGLILAASPAVRARGLEVLRIIGGVHIFETDDRIESQPAAADITVTPLATEYITLEEAQSLLTFDLPTWLPEGFTMRDRHNPLVTLTQYPLDSGEMILIHLRWENLNGRLPALIDLRVDNRPEGGLIVGPRNGAEEATINGQPAALIYGGWHEDTGRYQGPEITLIWVDGGLKYTLLATRDQGITVEDLIRIAGSMQ